MPPENLPALKVRHQVRDKLREIHSYISEQRGNDPNDATATRAIQRILKDMYSIRSFAWLGRPIPGLNENYRQLRVGSSYILYYYVVDPATLIIVIDLRHIRQKPLKPNTLRKYKSEVESQ